jgi:glucan phosphoethanolaminetransferase (alkaline phosphatase superfamily)
MPNLAGPPIDDRVRPSGQFPTDRREWLRHAATVWTFFVLALPNLLLAFLAVDVAPWCRAALCGASIALILLAWMTLPPRWFQWLSVPLFVLVPFECFHILVLAAPSTTGMIRSLLDTAPSEIRDVAGSFVLPLLVVVALPALQIAAALAFPRIQPIAPRHGTRNRTLATVPLLLAAATLLLAASDAPVSSRSFHRAFQGTFPLGTLDKIGGFAFDEFRQHRADSVAKGFRWDARLENPLGGRSTIVLVIGETSRAGNWSAYGYGRPTTPHLEGSPDLLRFADATSGANLTEIALPQLLTRSTPERPYASDSSTSLLACFREAGYRTWWISTQNPAGRESSRTGKIVADADLRQFLTTPGKATRPFDHELLPALESALADSFPRKLVVLHTLGSHHAYANRYPADFARFNGRQELAAYDNSILYTDHVLSQILSRLRATPGVNAFLYVSDHGEALGENGLSNHGRPHPVRAEVEIPFLIWISPELHRLRPDLLANLRSHLRARIRSSDLGPTLMSIAGIESPLADRSSSLADSAYRERTRWVLTPQGDLVDADRLSGSSFHTGRAPR